MPRYRKLQRTYFGNVLIINLITITFLGSIWIAHEFVQYKDEVKLLKDNFIENQKTTVKNEVENAIFYINNINKETEKELKNTLQTELTEVFEIVTTLHKNYNLRSDIRTQQITKDLLKKINMGTQKNYIFIVNNNNINDLDPNPNIKNEIFPIDSGNRKQFIKKSENIKIQGEGLISYNWSTSDGKSIHQVSYVKYFAPYDWIIGVGTNYEEFAQKRQQEVILMLSNVRFGKNREGYLFANTQNGDPLFTNGLITVGQPSIWNLEDPNGVKIIQEEQKAAQKPEGDFINYSWRKIFTQGEKAYGIDKPTSPKVSFMMGYRPWNWMIGAGFYQDDIDIIIAQKREALHQIIRHHVILITTSLIVSILVSLVLIKLIQKKIDININRFISFFKKASSGKARIDPEKIYYNEFIDLANYANNMIEQRELAEHDFKQIVEVFPFPICLYKNNSISYLNPQWHKIIGYNIDEIPTIAKSLIKCFPEKEERIKLRNLKEFDSANSSLLPDDLHKVTCKDGKVRHMHLNIIRMTDLRSMITLEDFTYRKKVEDDLNAARIKAEESDKLKSAFLANMSHEIRTPMNAILGFSGLLQDEKISEEKRKKYFTHINRSSESLLNLINDILDISKIEAGQLNIQITKGNLKNTFISVDAEIKSICSTMQKNDIEIISKYDLTDEIGMIETDFLRLKQILLNLLNNALKFTSKGIIEFGCNYINSGTLKFYVKDSGIGIRHDKMGLIFNRFSKIEDNNSYVYRGAGLGLAISKKLVETLGGSIWVESEYGKGSTFYFTINSNLNLKKKKA